MDINAHLHPCLLLPEVMASVFYLAALAAVPKSDFKNDRHWPSRRESPLNAAATCRAWRYIALSNPRLWGVVDLCGVNHGVQRQRDIATQWLARSKQTQLKVYYRQYLWDEEDDDVDDADWGTAENTVRLLEQNQYRWHKMDLIISGFRPGNPFRMTLLNLPQLVELRLQVQESERAHEEGAFSRDQVTPLGAYRDFFVCPDSEPAIAFPDITLRGGQAIAPNLTSLHLSLFSFGSTRVAYHMLCFLRHCPRLEFLFTETRFQFEEDPEEGDGDSPLHLPFLRCIRTIATDEEPVSFFRYFRAPMLKSFQFEYATHFELVQPDFLEFAILSKPPIEYLDLGGINNQMPDDYSHGLAQVLRALPAIELLSMCWYGEDTFPWELLSGTSQPPLLPNLKLVSVTMHDDAVRLLEEIADLVETYLKGSSFQMEIILSKKEMEKAKGFQEQDPQSWAKFEGFVKFRLFRGEESGE